MVIVVSCPECGRVATVVDRCVLESTDGPVEHSRIRCSAGHHFLMPTEGLAGLAALRTVGGTDLIRRRRAREWQRAVQPGHPR